MRTMFEKNPVLMRRAQYTDWFPSVVAKYQITQNLEWQFGANKGLLRPRRKRSHTATWVQNDNANPPTVTTANAALEPERLKVYQTRPLLLLRRPVAGTNFAPTQQRRNHELHPVADLYRRRVRQHRSGFRGLQFHHPVSTRRV
jgi:hypothetical protein